MEEAGPAAGQPPGTENVEQPLFDIGREIARPGTDVQLDVERHGDRRVDLDIVAGQPVAFYESAKLVFELCVDAAPAAPVDGDEHRVPASGPAPRRYGALHARLAFDHVGVVVRGPRALLPPERLRSVESRLRQRLRIDATLRGHRVAHAVYAVRDHVTDRFRTDVAEGAIAEPEPCVESFGRQRRTAVHAVAEAQHRVAVIFGLDDKFRGFRAACKKIALHGPAAQIAFAADIHRRT